LSPFTLTLLRHPDKGVDNLMEENTLTFTARDTNDPKKVATFTLQNGDVSVQLGNTMLEQVVTVNEKTQTEEDVDLVDWTKATAIGTVQKLLHTLPVNDFEADIDDKTFQTTAWVRTGGLRAVPMSMTWQEVDNPNAAHAFVEELDERKKNSLTAQTMPAILDYWASWIVAGISGLAVIILIMRLVKRIVNDDS
jgi:hypothetical protein